jgi:hypothetical protein
LLSDFTLAREMDGWEYLQQHAEIARIFDDAMTDISALTGPTVAGETAGAATFALMNSIGQLGGLAGNYTIGFLNDRTHSLMASFGLIALVYIAAGGLILSLKTRVPLGATPVSALSHSHE